MLVTDIIMSVLMYVLRVFEKFRGDQVNRAKSEQCLVGGKGQNCAKGACNIVPGCCMVAQFLGGQTGEQIQKSLEDKNVIQPESVIICRFHPE